MACQVGHSGRDISFGARNQRDDATLPTPPRLYCLARLTRPCPQADVYDGSDPFVVVFWNEKEIGRTKVGETPGETPGETRIGSRREAV